MINVIKRDYPLTDVEVRDSGNGTDFTISGYAAVYNSESRDLGGFTEVIKPGAFTEVLSQNPDVVLSYNHEDNFLLARTVSGTLELREDARGLKMWARVAPTSYANDLRVLMERGDVSKASFMFSLAQDGDEWTQKEDGSVLRSIGKIGSLVDVSVVNRPAYDASEAYARDYQRALEEGRISGRSIDAGPQIEDAAPVEEARQEDTDTVAPSVAGSNEALELLKLKSRSKLAMLKTNLLGGK